MTFGSRMLYKFNSLCGNTSLLVVRYGFVDTDFGTNKVWRHLLLKEQRMCRVLWTIQLAIFLAQIVRLLCQIARIEILCKVCLKQIKFMIYFTSNTFRSLQVHRRTQHSNLQMDSDQPYSVHWGTK